MQQREIVSPVCSLNHCDQHITISARRDQSQLPDVVLCGDQSFGATDQIACRVCGVSSVLLRHVFCMTIDEEVVVQ